MLDKYGYRPNVGIILINQDNKVFWGKRIREQAWQFPQGGINPEESPEQAMFRELHEEIGLHPEHVEIIGRTRNWLRYNVPERWVRREWRGHYRGQKQIWFLLRMKADDSAIALDADAHPEFDSWRWSDYWLPLDAVIEFKRGVYMRALTELSALLNLPPPPPTLMPRPPRGRGNGAARSNRASAAARGTEDQDAEARSSRGGRPERGGRTERTERHAPRGAEASSRRGGQARPATGMAQRARAEATTDSARPPRGADESDRRPPAARQDDRQHPAGRSAPTRKPGPRPAQGATGRADTARPAGTQRPRRAGERQAPAAGHPGRKPDGANRPASGRPPRKAARPGSPTRVGRTRSRQVTGGSASQDELRPTSLAEPPARPRRRSRPRR